MPQLEMIPPPETALQYVLTYTPNVIVGGFLVFAAVYCVRNIPRVVRILRRDAKNAARNAVIESKEEIRKEIYREIDGWKQVAERSAELTGFSLGAMACLILTAVEVAATRASNDLAWVEQLEHLGPAVERLIVAMDACAQVSGSGSAGDLASDLRLLNRKMSLPINPTDYPCIAVKTAEISRKLAQGDMLTRRADGPNDDISIRSIP